MEALVKRDWEAAARALKTLAEASEHDHARRAILRFAQQLSEAAFSSSEEAYNVLYAALIDAGSTIPDERDNPFLVAAAAAEEAAAAADAAQSAAASAPKKRPQRRTPRNRRRLPARGKSGGAEVRTTITGAAATTNGSARASPCWRKAAPKPRAASSCSSA